MAASLERECLGEARAAEPCILRQLAGAHRLDVVGALVVPELTPVEVPALEPARPAEERVAGRLQKALARDDPLTLVVPACSTDERLEDRSLRLLALHQERVTVRAPEQRDEAPCSDAARPDDLEGDVDEAVVLHQQPMVRAKGLEVALPVVVESLRNDSALSGSKSSSRTTSGGRGLIRRRPFTCSVSLEKA